MWYPNIVLTRKIRLGFMFFLITVFFIVSPLIILYTAGYRFDFARKEVKETGVITIDIQPKTATVTLNDVILKDKMPIHLANRAPGIYTIDISAPGYLSWDFPIEVQSKQTTYITNTALYKSSLPTFEYASVENEPDPIISTDGRYAVTTVSKGNGVSEVLLYDIEQEQETLIWRGSSELPLDINWSPYAPILNFKVVAPETVQIEVIDARSPSDAMSYSFASIDQGSNLSAVQWSEGRQDTLYIERDKTIYALASGTESEMQIVTNTAKWYVDDAQNIWSFDDTNTLYKNSEEIQRFGSLPDNFSILDVTDRLVLIEGYGMGTRILWLDSGESTDIATTHVYKLQDSDEPSGWLLWSTFEIYRLNTETGEHRLVTRTNKPIFDIIWAPNFKSYVYVSEGQITAFHPQYRTSQVLFQYENSGVSNVSINNENDYITFVSTINGRAGVYKREL